MNLIVGAGLSGCVLAELIARKAKEEVLIIDRREHLAGNLYDEKCEGIWVHRYGPHIFHTEDSRVWNYVNAFAKFYPYLHRVSGLIDGVEVPLPFNLTSLERLFPQSMVDLYVEKLSKHFSYGQKISVLELQKVDELKALGDFIYSKVFENYTAKQWGISLGELDESVARRVPFVFGRAEGYFADKYQGIPLEGYTKFLARMISHPKIKLKLGVDFKDLQITAKRIFYCGGIDEYFDFALGKLDYRGVKFDFLSLPQEHFQDRAVVNYPNQFDFTRITEYKHFLPHPKFEHTILSMEYPQAFDDSAELVQAYPIPSLEQKRLYESYKELAREEEGVYFCGRLGKYAYLDMDDAILEAFALFEKVFVGV